MSYIGWIEPSGPERMSVGGHASRLTMLLACAVALWPFVALAVLACLANGSGSDASALTLGDGP